MKSNPQEDVTRILKDIRLGDASAANKLFPILYDELRDIAGKFMYYENSNHTMQATSLVHEAYVKLLDKEEIDWKGRTHFLAVSAQAMRRLLVDHARSKNRSKRGGEIRKVGAEVAEWSVLSTENNDHILAVDDALNRLVKLDPLQAKIVEMRFFSGMTMQEVADELDLSKRNVEGQWTMIKAWLKKELKAY